jgi:hypothetical protein
MGKAPPIGECIEGGGRHITPQSKNWEIHPQGFMEYLAKN